MAMNELLVAEGRCDCHILMGRQEHRIPLTHRDPVSHRMPRKKVSKKRASKAAKYQGYGPSYLPQEYELADEGRNAQGKKGMAPTV